MDLRRMLDAGSPGRPSDQPGTLQRPGAGDEPECSRKGCRRHAQWIVLWNNPKIHAPERRKTWLACGEHRSWLEDFLRQRLFWRSTEPLERPGRSAGEGPADEGTPDEGTPDEGPAGEASPGESSAGEGRR